MSEIRDRDELVLIVNRLMICAMEDIDSGRNEAGPTTLDLVERIENHDAALRAALAAAERRAEEAEAYIKNVLPYPDEVADLRARLRELERQRSDFDCRFAGPYAEMSGRHCPAERPCARCEAERIERERDEALGAMRADDNRLRDAAVRVWGEHVRGCDTPDAMADLIEHLRTRLRELEHIGTGAARSAMPSSDDGHE